MARRAQGEPLAYATELAGFRTLDVKVDRRVLIPRPETEGLVELVLAWGGEEKGPLASWGVALDLGTGSGCVALSLAVEGRFHRVVATDVSADALAVARENLAQVRPPVPVELRQGSLFRPVAGELYDVIVSNPPYVTEDEFARLDTGVRNFEPPEALVSGEDGLELTRCLVEHAGAHLAPGGLFALEVDSSRADTVLELARVAGWRAARLEMDVFGRARYLLATMESNQ